MASWISNSCQSLARQAVCLGQDLHTIGFEFRSSFNSDVAEILDNIRNLDGLSQTDFERILSSLYDAARAYVSACWWSIFWNIISTRRHIVAFLIAMAASFIAIVFY